MYVVVTYDVATETPEGRRRLRRVAQACLNYGQRVQKSVFECAVDETQFFRLKEALLEEADLAEDSLRFYRIQEPHKDHIEHFGQRESVDFDGPLIV